MAKKNNEKKNDSNSNKTRDPSQTKVKNRGKKKRGPAKQVDVRLKKQQENFMALMQGRKPPHIIEMTEDEHQFLSKKRLEQQERERRTREKRLAEARHRNALAEKGDGHEVWERLYSEKGSKTSRQLSRTRTAIKKEREENIQKDRQAAYSAWDQQYGENA